MIEATSALQEYQDKWFPKKTPKVLPEDYPLVDASLWPPLAEHPVEIDRVKEMLRHISADCSHEQWRNIIWSVLSTGWSCAEEITLEWSLTAPERFKNNPETFNNIIRDFDATRGITLGTLIHHARVGGYEDDAVLQSFGCDFKPQQNRFRFKTALDVRNTDPMKWRVKKLLPETGIGAIFGPSGSGKTFLAFDMAASIALGRPFYGRKVVQCPVVYVALEGGAGVSQRVQAWEQHHGQQLPETFRMVTDPFSLLNSDAGMFAEDLNAVGLSGGVVIIDTLNQSAPGADENSPADMGKIISNAMVIQRLTNSLVLLVHHTGKDTSKGLRGHSSLVAAMDVTIKVERKVVGRVWSIDKLKDGDDDVSYPFKLELVTLGVDEDGDPITSCVAIGDMFRISKPKPPTGKNQIAVLEAIMTNAGSTLSMPYEVGLTVSSEALDVPIKYRKERATDAIQRLVDGGHLILDGGTLQIV
ncbi:MAG: AAA family ATPase [Fluviibacter phosphoraccumulans]